MSRGDSGLLLRVRTKRTYGDPTCRRNESRSWPEDYDAYGRLAPITRPSRVAYRPLLDSSKKMPMPRAATEPRVDRRTRLVTTNERSIDKHGTTSARTVGLFYHSTHGPDPTLGVAQFPRISASIVTESLDEHARTRRIDDAVAENLDKHRRWCGGGDLFLLIAHRARWKHRHFGVPRDVTAFSNHPIPTRADRQRWPCCPFPVSLCLRSRSSRQLSSIVGAPTVSSLQEFHSQPLLSLRCRRYNTGAWTGRRRIRCPFVGQAAAGMPERPRECSR